MRFEPSPTRSLLALTLVAWTLSGCSTLKNAAGDAPQSASAPAGASSAPHPPQAGQPPAFDTVIKGAERTAGLLPLWKRQDKVWIELTPASLGRALFLSPSLSTGIGESGLFGGLMASRFGQVGRPQWVEFRRVQQQVQLLAINAAYTAQAGTPQARSVQAAFSPSLLASVPVASVAHPQSGAILIEANSLLVSDLLGLGLQLQRAYKQGYALDPRNSALTVASTHANHLSFEVLHHFATNSIAISGAPGTPAPGVPVSVPDPRSLFVTVNYSLTPLPEPAMTPRPADPRVGYFTSTVADFTQDLTRTPRQHYINRWRLEKKDATAALSPPIHPLVYQLDASIPLDYRATITEGILAWNKAFEAIGYQDVIQVRAPSSDPKAIETDDVRASIRWMTNSQPSFGAIGPSHVDPRSGEILQAHIALESLSSRAIRTLRSQIISPSTQAPQPDRCEHAQEAAEQLGLALEVLESRGLLDPDSPEVRAFFLAYLKDTTMHEVGHTLGLRHNFRGSRWHTAEQLADPVLTQREGISASVMDYSPINLPAPGRPAPAPFQTTIGPYDYWAIEYGYKSLPADDAKALSKIAERSADPAMAEALAFGTDEDNYFGLDPQALTFDLGRDPLVFARQRFALDRDLIARQSTQNLGPQDDPTLLRRRVSYALRDIARTAPIAWRQVGGLVTRRDAPGSGRDALDPLPAATQRAALDLITQELLSSQALSLSPALQRRMAPDYMERLDSAGDASGLPSRTDFSVADSLLAIQRSALDALMSDTLAERLLDNIDKTRDRPESPLTVRELHRRLSDAVWGTHVSAPQGVDASWRRNLQREHVNRLSALVVRSASSRADVRAVVRQQAKRLLKELEAKRWGDAASTSDAHRRDCMETLERALNATVVRTGP
ncbi:MAG: zinc-dependent metalloprotease [Pseudomonadota bacterium]